ncbi:FRG domain-containing protein [Enterococcus larvae]|uniref:FRG domain-containing protein n=1 Tax=Enterococcus larvae TaxID=2794352 RepID=UPI003F349B59
MEKTEKKSLVTYLIEIDSVIKEARSETTSFYEGECITAFRGEPMDYGNTAMMPSLFREEYSINDELNLLDLLCDYSVVEKGMIKNIEKAIESQHYIAISRLLDVTFNILPAIFFAASLESQHDGFIYIYTFPEHFSPQSDYIENFYTAMLNKNNENIPFLGDFKVITHGYNNERMKSQQGGFILFPGEKFRQIPRCYYKKICIKSEDKIDLLYELDLMFNISEATIYPEKDKRKALIKNHINKSKQVRRYDSKISIEDEVISYLKRLDFEFYLMKKKSADKKELARIFRKEISDLCFFISESHLSQEKIYELNKKCIKRLTMYYKIIENEVGK